MSSSTTRFDSIGRVGGGVAVRHSRGDMAHAKVHGAKKKTDVEEKDRVDVSATSKKKRERWKWTAWVLAAAVLVRLAVGLHPHSGQGTPPKFGDYEAQRHWMEITVHTPTKDWYRDTENNPMEHWGLDYPRCPPTKAGCVEKPSNSSSQRQWNWWRLEDTNPNPAKRT